MSLRDVERTWNALGERDPYWAILTAPGTQNNRWSLEDFFASGREEIAGVMAHLSAVAPRLLRRHALDFGCGVGRLTRPLAGHFDHVTGVDIAPSMIERARQLHRDEPRCKFVVNARADLSLFPDHSFDFVYSYLTLQHMPPECAKGYIGEFVRVLAPGGVAHFQLPSRRRALCSLLAYGARVTRAFFPSDGPAMAMHWVPRKEIEAVLRRGGAEILAIRPDTSAGADYEGFRYTARKP